MRVSRAAALMAICLFGASSLEASQISLSAVERQAALMAIKDAFDKRYAFAETRPKIIERLNEAERGGRYELDDPAAFADRVTEDLQAVSSDKHLVLKVDSAAYAAAIAQPESDEGEDAFWRGRALRNHHGLTELRLLPGNVRYLRIAA